MHWCLASRCSSRWWVSPCLVARGRRPLPAMVATAAMLPALATAVAHALRPATIAVVGVAVVCGAMAAAVGVLAVAVAAMTAVPRPAAPRPAVPPLAVVTAATSRVVRAAAAAWVLRLPRAPAWIATRWASTRWPSAAKAIASGEAWRDPVGRVAAAPPGNEHEPGCPRAARLFFCAVRIVG